MSEAPEKTVKDIQTDVQERMLKSIESVKQNLITIRTGRASANMLDRVKVDYYGTFLHKAAVVGCRRLSSSGCGEDCLQESLDV